MDPEAIAIACATPGVERTGDSGEWRAGKPRWSVGRARLILRFPGLALVAVTAMQAACAIDLPFLRPDQPRVPPAAVALGPTWTPTASRTPRPPSPTPPPTITLSPEQLILALGDDIHAAEELSFAHLYREAIDLWDEILEQVPDYGYGYYRRAQAYLGLNDGEHIYEVASENTRHALEDIDTAIAIGDQVTGDYYLARYDVYGELANLEACWRDPRPYSRLALENLQTALALRNSDPLSPRSLAFQLASVGACDAALSEARRLFGLIETGDPPSAGINTALADAYLCGRDYGLALAHFDAAIRIQDTAERRYGRAIALYGLGRPDEALEILNSMIEAQPTFYGYRYYFRALINYDLGMPDLAREDLQTGAVNTWDRAGMAALVSGLLAREAGDQEDAIGLLRLAETTLGNRHSPMLARAQAELAALGEPPLSGTPQIPIWATPMPSATPSLEGDMYGPTPPAESVDYNSGAVSFNLGSNDYRTFRFAPGSPAFVGEVRSLAIWLGPSSVPANLDLTLFLWNPKENFWTMYVWDGQPIAVEHPGRFVLPTGEVFVAVQAGSAAGSASISWLRARLEIESPDGGVTILGPPSE